MISREAPIGEACLFPEGFRLCLGQRMMLARPDLSKILPTFVLWNIYSSVGRNYVELRKKGTTVGHLRVPEVFNFPIIVPPITEQAKIIASFMKKMDDNERLAVKVVESLSFLNEYRAAFIASAVSGTLEI